MAAGGLGVFGYLFAGPKQESGKGGAQYKIQLGPNHCFLGADFRTWDKSRLECAIPLRNPLEVWVGVHAFLATKGLGAGISSARFDHGYLKRFGQAI